MKRKKDWPRQGQELKRIRVKDFNMTQKEFATHLDYGSSQFISNMEGNRAPVPFSLVDSLVSMDIDVMRLKKAMVEDYKELVSDL